MVMSFDLIVSWPLKVVLGSDGVERVSSSLGGVPSTHETLRGARVGLVSLVRWS